MSAAPSPARPAGRWLLRGRSLRSGLSRPGALPAPALSPVMTAREKTISPACDFPSFPRSGWSPQHSEMGEDAEALRWP